MAAKFIDDVRHRRWSFTVVGIGRFVWYFAFVATFCWAARANAETEPDFRALFFQEVLTPEPTTWTPRFDAYHRNSYFLDKVDLVSGLDDVARSRGKTLLAVLVVGPMGPLWSYDVITFVREGDRVRVVVVVFPHARIVAKRTSTISESDFSWLSESLRSIPGLEHEDSVSNLRSTLATRASSNTSDLSSEWQANLVFVDRRQRKLVFGRLDEFREDRRVRTLGRLLNPLLSAARRTYGDGQSLAAPQAMPPDAGLAWLAMEISDEPLPELDAAVAHYGFEGFDNNKIMLGLGGEFGFGRARVGYDVMFGGRSAAHAHLDASAVLVEARTTPRIGLELWRFRNLTLMASAGLRLEAHLLRLGAAAFPANTDEGVLHTEQSVALWEFGLAAECYIARTWRSGMLVSTRIGYARRAAESDLSDRTLLGNPSTAGRGAFVALAVGFAGAR